MYLIVGLGNPGKKYDKTRHNVGFDLIDIICKKENIKLKMDKARKTEIAMTNIGGQKVVLMKPQTFMNLSGEAVKSVMDYYDINIENVCIIYDDMDIPKGKIKLKLQGGAGGHNGMKSIISLLKTQEFKRLRIGIQKDYDEDTVDYVLGRFSSLDRKKIEVAFENAESALRLWFKLNFNEAMTLYNRD